MLHVSLPEGINNPRYEQFFTHSPKRFSQVTFFPRRSLQPAGGGFQIFRVSLKFHPPRMNSRLPSRMSFFFHPRFDWLIDWLIACLIDWLIACLIDWLIDCLIDWLLACLIDWLIACLIDWLIACLIDWLIDCLLAWLIDWLIDCLIACLLACLIDWLIDWLQILDMTRWQNNESWLDWEKQNFSRKSRLYMLPLLCQWGVMGTPGFVEKPTVRCWNFHNLNGSTPTRWKWCVLVIKTFCQIHGDLWSFNISNFVVTDFKIWKHFHGCFDCKEWVKHLHLRFFFTRWWFQVNFLFSSLFKEKWSNLSIFFGWVETQPPTSWGGFFVVSCNSYITPPKNWVVCHPRHIPLTTPYILGSLRSAPPKVRLVKTAYRTVERSTILGGNGNIPSMAGVYPIDFHRFSYGWI